MPSWFKFIPFASRRSRQGWRRLGAVLVLSVVGARAAEVEEDLMPEAIRLYEQGHYAAARDRFRIILDRRGADVALDFYLGRLALWFDDPREALRHLERAASVAPGEARVQNALGDAFGLTAQSAPLWEKLGWAEKARRAYEKAVTLAPQNPAWRWSLMGFYGIAPRIAGGGMDKAFQQAEEIRRLDPAGGRIASATLHLLAKRPAAAFAEFDAEERRSPDDFLTLYHIGRCAAVSGQQLERGRAALQRCLELGPPCGQDMPTAASTHQRLAEILQQLGDREGAQRHLARVRDTDPDFRAAKVALKN